MQLDSPRRRSFRTSAKQSKLDPYRLSPVKPQADSAEPAIQGSLAASIYLAFVSRRHLHGYLLLLSWSILVASFIVFALWGGVIAAVPFAISLPGLLWYLLFRPIPKAHAKSKELPFLWMEGSAGKGPKLVRMASCYVAATGFKDEYGYDVMGLYANEFIAKGRPITEYGQVFTDDKGTYRDKRWFKTINNMFCHIDGNPSHPLNGGIRQMASNHCLASIANHAKQYNAYYKDEANLATPRAVLEICKNLDREQTWPCTILYASLDIHPGQQILTDYEPNSSKAFRLHFRNESLLLFLGDIRKALKDGVDRWRA